MNEDSTPAPESLIGDLAGAGKVINSEVARRAYDDALSPAMRELGGLSRDSLKAFRLFTAPIQMLAAYQDRFAGFCERVRDKVPEEHQREAAPEIARPVMEAFASTSEESPLMAMFEELMANAIDDRHADKISPTFAPLIQSFSPLEAKLVQSLKSADQTLDVFWDPMKTLICGHLKTNINFADFGGNAHHLTMSQNLKTKNIVAVLDQKLSKDADYSEIDIPSGQQIRRFTYRLTMFGVWFADSCVPPTRE